MNKHVLVIAQQQEMGLLVKMLLERARGDRVVIVESAQEAFEYLAQEVPDLVIFTWYWVWLVPGKPDDFSRDSVETVTLYRQFLERWPDWHIPTLVMTAANPKEYEPMAKAAGLTGHLSCPFNQNELVAACEAVLRGEKYFRALESG